jgi:hypothetical protein
MRMFGLVRRSLSLAALLALSACPSQVNPTGSGGSAGQGGSAGEGGSAGAGGDAGMGGEAGTGGEAGEGGMAGAGGAAGSGGTGGTGGSGPVCGDGVIEGSEKCEGQNFNGKTCADYGLAGGSLQCNAFCQVVLNGCTPAESCGDGQDNDVDGFPDCADSDCASKPQCLDSCFAPQQGVVPLFESFEIAGKANSIQSSCAAFDGPEAIFEVEAPIAGTLTANASGDGVVAVSIRTACADLTSELSCDFASDFASAIATLDVAAGEKVLVVVESASAFPGFVNVQIDIPFPEGFQDPFACSDEFDNDGDGLLDCGDPSACKGGPNCTGGVIALGQACFGNFGGPNECSSSDGDPVCLSDFGGFPGGYCSEFCDVALQDCPGDGLCAEWDALGNGDVYPICLDGCATAAECRPGYTCTDLGGGQLACTKDLCGDLMDNDGDGLTDCEDTSGIVECSPGQCTGGAAATGAPCNQNADCFSDANDPICFPSPNGGQGWCSQFCSTALQDCGPGAQCIDNLGLPSGAGQCHDKCGGMNGVCSPGLACVNVGAGVFVCLP